MSERGISPEESRKGMIYGLLAYGAWGVLPIYFHALIPAGALEILAQRILWAAVFCLVYWIVRGDLGWLRMLLRRPRQAMALTVAAYVLALNWGIYIWAVANDNVLESSLGYFINPLMLVLVGVVVLKERLNTMQWLALALGFLAVLVISVDYGRLPLVALTLAVSFTMYGYIKKTVGVSIGAVQSMTAESLVLVPFAIATLWWVKAHENNLTFASEGWAHTQLLIGLGVITILPLTLFTSAATRLPLSMIGLLQYLAPTGQFLVAVLVFHEHMPLVRWVGFGFVWMALVILTVDSFRRSRQSRRDRALLRRAEAA